MKEYKTKQIQLNSDRRLIYRVKEAGIKTIHPKGKWTRYGYEKLALVAEITSLREMRLFNKIKRELEELPPPKKKTYEEKKLAWCRRLIRLVGDEYELTLEDAIDIADSKIEDKYDRIAELDKRQDERYSCKRDKLISKMERENPLRYIKDVYHARSIMNAHDRHTRTPYEAYLKEAHYLEEEGLLEKGMAKDYAYDMIKYGYSDLV